MGEITTEETGSTRRFREKRQAILAAAADAINEQSAKGMTFADVARRVGLNTTSVTYQTDAETCARIPAILRAVVEAEDRVFVRCGLIGFGASSIDFELLFDSAGADYVAFYDGRTAVGVAILRRFAAEGIEIAYPTQVNLNARADGTIVDPVEAHP